MNAKHQFKYTYNETDLEEFSPLEVTFEMPAEISLTQMLNNFEQYLRACGFFFDGKVDIVQDGYDLPEEEPEGGCMADWDDDEEDSPTFHDTLSTAICEDAKKKNSCYGLEETSSPCETSKWDEQFDVTKTTVSSKESKWKKEAERGLKEWNEGIAKLDNEQKQKRQEEIQKMSDLHYEATKEVVKNKWFHGLCNPPSPDWKNLRSS